MRNCAIRTRKCCPVSVASYKWNWSVLRWAGFTFASASAKPLQCQHSAKAALGMSWIWEDDGLKHERYSLGRRGNDSASSQTSHLPVICLGDKSEFSEGFTQKPSLYRGHTLLSTRASDLCKVLARNNEVSEGVEVYTEWAPIKVQFHSSGHQVIRRGEERRGFIWLAEGWLVVSGTGKQGQGGTAKTALCQQSSGVSELLEQKKKRVPQGGTWRWRLWTLM